MAVQGEFNGQPVILNNAAEEATLRDILDVLSNATGGGRIFDSTAARQLGASTRQASGSIMGMLSAAYRTEDGLDRLSRSQREARSALNSFTTSLYSNARSLVKGFASGDLSQATQGVFDTVNNTLKGGLDVIQKRSANPIVDIFAELGKVAGDVFVGGAAYVEGTVREFSNKFDELANVGFFAGEGINEFRYNLNKAGMTFAEFEGLVKNNSESLRTLGGSAAQGARQVIKMRAAMVGQEEQFYRLGFNFTELAPLVADYAASLERGTGSMILNDQDLIDQTAKYATNLRMLSDLTGKNADQLKNEAAAAARRSQNQAYLMDLESQGVAGAARTFGSLFTLVEQKFPGYENLLSDYFTNIGVAQDETTGLLESTNPALAAALRDLKSGVETGAITQENAADAFIGIMQSREEAIRAYQRGQADLAQVKIPGFEGIGTSIESIDELTRLNRDALKEQYDSIKTNKDAGTLAMIGLKDATESFTLATDAMKTSLANAFGQELISAINYAADGLEAMGDFVFENFTTLGKITAYERAISKFPVQSGQEITPTTGGVAFGGAAPLPGTPGYEQSMLYKSLSKLTDEELAERGFKKIGGSGMVPLSFQKMARGGIIPNMGPEGMPIRAGDGVAEAVVPLPDGRSIPVTMRDNQAFKDMSSKLDLMTSINRAMLDAMEENNRLVKQGNNLIS